MNLVISSLMSLIADAHCFCLNAFGVGVTYFSMTFCFSFFCFLHGCFVVVDGDCDRARFLEACCKSV